ncbi:MAG: VWA domain-containing protein [Vicinamibacterales bacterium]|jgi:hypothetical protein|nr:VWA domain-containing protein [Vicinamibacterales bacterium]
MSFLAPALLAALAAIAIPIVVHLVQRDRRRVVQFPSLMFLRKIPNQSVKRRAIRHWPLLLLRIAAFALLALAFARPFWPGAGAAAAAGAGREVVLLLDTSHSMAYGGVWARAQAAAKQAVSGLGPADRGTVAFFGSEVEVGVRAASERAALAAAIDRAAPGAGATRYGPALRAAAGLLEASALPRREIILVSDFQKSGWDQAQETTLPPGVSLRTVPVGEATTANASIVSLAFARQEAPGGERITASARIVNRSGTALQNREVSLEVDGHREDTRQVSAAPNGVETVAFAPFTIAGRPARVTARLAADALPVDDAFHAVIAAGGRIPVLIIEAANPGPDASLYLARALAVGNEPGFETAIAPVDRVTAEQVGAASVVILNDTRPPSGAAGRMLEARVRAGMGLLVAAGDRSSWPDDAPDLLPCKPGAPVDRSGTTGGALGFVDYGHPVFDVFAAPRSGDLTAARMFRYRPCAPAQGATVVARFDDGNAALVERRVDAGTVLAWTSSLDSYWNDLALRPVFVPFVHQAMRHLGRYADAKGWRVVGEVVDPAELTRGLGLGSGARGLALGASSDGKAAVTLPHPTVLTPHGNPLDFADPSRTTFTLTEPGFYEVRSEGDKPGEGAAVAVNVSAAESDLTPFNPAELSAAVAGSSEGAAAGAAQPLTPEDDERRQSVWWFLLAAGVVLLAVEAVVAGRFPRIAQG